MAMKRAKKRAGMARTGARKRASTKSGARKRASPKRATAKRTAAKRAPAKRSSTKRATTKRSKKYGPAAERTVESAMHRHKKGTLKSSSGRKVTSRKQAIAIGISEARAKGEKVPPPPEE